MLKIHFIVTMAVLAWARHLFQRPLPQVLQNAELTHQAPRGKVCEKKLWLHKPSENLTSDSLRQICDLELSGGRERARVRMGL